MRIAYIELGSDWVDYTLKKLEKAADHYPSLFKERPTETFRQHCYVSPFYEEDLRALANLIGVERIIFGSDWPHAEGLYEPIDFVKDLAGFTDAEIERGLDHLADQQREDGGWPIHWLEWSPGTALEGRPRVTLDALRVLQAYDEAK